MKHKLTYRAETFDLMQYFCRRDYDPLVRAMLCFDRRLDEQALRRALTLSAGEMPLIFCRFRERLPRPRWETCGLDGADVLHLTEVEDESAREPAAMRLLSGSVDIFKGPQLRLDLVRGPRGDTLCVLVNHMVCDGGGFKEYLYLLSRLYEGCAGEHGAGFAPALSMGPRGAGQLFRTLRFSQKAGLLFRRYDIKSQKNQVLFPLPGDENAAFLARHRVEHGDLAAIKSYAKSRGATVNDMLLTAYARVLMQKTGAPQVTLPCPVDLRKYLAPGRPHGICNLTTNYVCRVASGARESFDDTLRSVHRQMERQKQDPGVLKSVLLLETAARLLPYPVFQRVFPKVFHLPTLSYTNLAVLDKNRLLFGGEGPSYAYLTAAIKHSPQFQVTVSTFDGVMTLSCNLHGTEKARREAEAFLSELHAQMLRR